MKSIEARRGNTVGVNAIDAKIKELTLANVAAQAGPASAPQSAGANAALEDGAITALTPGTATKTEIIAKAKHGVLLGPVHPGAHITLQYVDGRWAMSNHEPDPNKWVNPDESNFSGNSLGIFSLKEARQNSWRACPTEPSINHFISTF